MHCHLQEHLCNSDLFSYVREWLNSMACGRIVDYDESSKTYFFPESRHSILTDKGGHKNIATFTQGCVLASQVYHQLQECFTKDGPLGKRNDRVSSF